MLSETEISDTGYTSSETSYAASVDDCEHEMEPITPKNTKLVIQISNEIDSFSYPIVAQTKSIIIPILYFMFIISIVQLVVFNINLTINNIIILNILGNPETFDIAFNITLIIVIIVWILLLYTERKWSKVPFDVDVDNNSIIHTMKRNKTKLNRIENDITDAIKEIHKLYFDDHQLQIWSQQLLAYKHQLVVFQNRYRRKSKQKTFKHHIKCIEKQCEDILNIIDENQFALLSAVLCHIQIRYSNAEILSLNDYNHYMQLFNSMVINEFNFYGGYHGMKKNYKGMVEVQEFEHLIKRVMDELDESQCTFVNY